MKYLRTLLAADWPQKDHEGLLDSIQKRTDLNPDYKFHLVREWLIGFVDDDLPIREIGLNEEGWPVMAGSDDRNYGFWLDTNMGHDDFEGEDVEPDVFEVLWCEFKGPAQPGGAT